jgi:hypothetical protein
VVPAAVVIYICVVACGAVGLLTYLTYAWRDVAAPKPGLVAMLIVAGALAQHFYVPVSPRRKVDLSIVVYFACVLLFGAPGAMWSTGLAQLLGQTTLWLRRNPLTGRRLRSVRSIAFNTAQFMLSAGLASLVYYRALPHTIPTPLDHPDSLWILAAAAAAAAARIQRLSGWSSGVGIVCGSGCSGCHVVPLQ